MPLRMISVDQLKFPGQGMINLLASLLYSAGMLIFCLTTVHSNTFNLSSNDMFRLNLILIFSSLTWSTFWSVSCLIAETALESFNGAFDRGEDELFCITLYKRLSDSLSRFFFFFISLTQFLSVVDTFLSLSKFFTAQKGDDQNEYLVFAGKLIVLGDQDSLVSVVKKSFQRVTS